MNATQRWFPFYLAVLLISVTGVGQIASTFDTDNDGWIVRDLTVDEIVSGEWSVYWTSPGHIYSPDVGSYFFSAPSKFLGDKSAYIGGTISFDIMNNLADYSTDRGTYFNLILQGDGIMLFHDGNFPKQPYVWTHIDASLNSDKWYKHWDINNQATADELAFVLGNLQGIYVYADWGWGGDTAYLDNVIMQVVPEPTTLSLLALGAILAGRKRK